MPGGDGTGPMGAGPRSGRGAGYCAGYDMPGYANPGFGWGRGMGFGRRCGFGGGGRGWRNWFYATGLPGWMRFGFGNVGPETVPAETEARFLNDQAQQLRQQIEAIQQRLDAIAPSQDAAKP